MLVSYPLRKKGGIFIKKIIFLILLAFTTISTINVKAETANFYEGEYIDGIYMNKYNYSNKTIYYQKARFFRKINTNEFAYCIEPFNFFNESSTYESTLNPNNLSKYQIDRISKIAHFGYGYKNHTDPKWYAITQFMIWKESDPNGGDYYFTNGLNGPRIDIFQSEMNEINNLVNNYSITPSFTNHTFNIVEDHQLTITDSNNILNEYTTNDNLTIENNTIKINNLKEGNYTYKLIKNDNYYNKPIIFYQSSTSQNLVNTGDINPIEIEFKVNIVKTNIRITKIDEDTLSIIPSGEASLDGAIYNLYDEYNNLIQELTITNNEAIVNNIDFGKYYIKEIKPGNGYTLDNNIYEVNITNIDNIHDLILKNKVVEKKIIIEKKYGDEYLLKGEKNISFNIFNNKKELIKTITTDSKGLVEIKLPFGSYEFIQMNSTEGYHKVDNFTITVDNIEEEYIELRDLKIKVPNTHTDNLLLIYIIKLLLITW